jgi:hypothetical protein
LVALVVLEKSGSPKVLAVAVVVEETCLILSNLARKAVSEDFMAAAVVVPQRI